MIRSVQIYIEGERLELFQDEHIYINLTFQNIRDIGVAFTDFTETFTIPASVTNNAIIQHFYDNSLNSTIDFAVQRSAYIEIDLIPFRSGMMQLNKCNLKNGQPESYEFTFYGRMLSLKEILGDDKLDALDWNQYTHIYNGQEIFNRVTDDFNTNEPVQYPLITATSYWSYGDGTSTDVQTDNGAILYTDLFPAVNLKNIFLLIEDRYDIDFVGNFINGQIFEECFLLLKKGETVKYTTEAIEPTFSFTGSTLEEADLGYDVYMNNPSLPNGAYSPRWYNTPVHSYNSSTNTFKSFFWANPAFVPGTVSFYNRMFVTVNATTDTLLNYLDVYEDDILINTVEFTGDLVDYLFYERTTEDYGYDDDDNGVISDYDSTPYGYSTPYDRERNIKIKFRSEGTQTIESSVKNRYDYSADNNYQTALLNSVFTSPLVTISLGLGTTLDFNRFIPDMKIIDFMAGLMKQFNLVFYPQITGVNFYSERVKMFVDNLDAWYQKGAIVDITKYVDTADITIANPPIFKKITFKNQKSESFFNIEYNELSQNNHEYGDYELNLPYKAEEYVIETPFEKPIITTFTDSDLAVGILLDKDYQQYTTKPILLMKRPQQTTIDTIKFDKGLTGIDTFDTYQPFTHDYLDGNSELNNLLFSVETSTFEGDVIYKNAFYNYYSSYLANVFNLKQRLTNLKVVFPTSLLTELQLNDRLIIRDKRYIINTIKLDLTMGNADVELIQDFRPILNPLSVPNQTFCTMIPFVVPNDCNSVILNVQADDGILINGALSYQFFEDELIEFCFTEAELGVWRVTEDGDVRLIETSPDTRVLEGELDLPPTFIVNILYFYTDGSSSGFNQLVIQTP